MPFGPYADFDECVLKNSDKSSPEGFCAWLHKKILGTWPSEMSDAKFPESWLNAYDAALVAKKPEKEAFALAETAAQEAGFEKASFGWVKQYQAPNMKTVKDVYVFASGTWTDSAGNERTWTNDELDRMVVAFKAGVPVMVPVKCGHTSDDFNAKIAEALGVPNEVITGDHGQGQIKVGNMTSLERKGDWNVATFGNIPEPIADLIEGGQYSTVSVEIEDEIGEYGPAITGVALLGAEEPAVEGATLEKALVFGGARKGARVWSFSRDQLPDPVTLRSEFDDIRSKVADIIKGKKGAPLFRALFGNITELFEHMVNGSHAAEPGSGKTDPNQRAANDQGNDALAKNKLEKGEKLMKLPKVLEGKKPEAIRAMTIPALAKLFAEGETPKVEELSAAFQEGDLAAIAAALGLGEEATPEDIMTAIAAMIEKAKAVPEGNEGGELGKELQKANDKIADLTKRLDGQAALSAWKEKTSAFVNIPGTPTEHAASLANIETKAGKEAAESQFAALEAANKLAAEAQKVIGTTRSTGPTDFDNEVAKYMDAHADTTKVKAIEAVSKSHPDLYFARRESWNQ